jgi:hypothetical protein
MLKAILQENKINVVSNSMYFRRFSDGRDGIYPIHSDYELSLDLTKSISRSNAVLSSLACPSLGKRTQ